MGYRRTPQADSDLDDIWHYAATGSGSLDADDRLVESINDRFYLLATHPNNLSNPDDDVMILRVLWGGRDIAALFGR